MADQGLIVFVGPGVMAEALVGGLIQRAGMAPQQIVLCGPRPERLSELADRYGVGGASTVVLSVKPQTVDGVLQELRGAIPPGAVVLSIVAGARLQDLTRG